VEKPDGMTSEIVVKKNLDDLSGAAAEFFVKTANSAITDNGRFTVALAGGSTPKSLYRLLASESSIDWSRVHFFFGDERNVPPDSPESNFRMANEAFLKDLDLADEVVHPWRTDPDDAKEAAALYQTELETFFTGLPRFDLILLGLGSDGHTASLFPYTSALEETERIAVANYVEKLDSWRLTLTYPVINNASNIAFLVSGEEKADVLKAVVEGNHNVHRLPSQGVKPTNGRLIWFADTAAASQVTAD
jgi:6-phosphogluconolactonase